MDAFVACETAYKNGYNRALDDLAERMKLEFGDDWCRIECSFDCLDEIVKEFKRK